MRGGGEGSLASPGRLARVCGRDRRLRRLSSAGAIRLRLWGIGIRHGSIIRAILSPVYAVAMATEAF
jgi:hypothetical protein